MPGDLAEDKTKHQDTSNANKSHVLTHDMIERQQNRFCGPASSCLWCENGVLPPEYPPKTQAESTSSTHFVLFLVLF